MPETQYATMYVRRTQVKGYLEAGKELPSEAELGCGVQRQPKRGGGASGFNGTVHHAHYDSNVHRVRNLSSGDTRIYLEFPYPRVSCHRCQAQVPGTEEARKSLFLLSILSIIHQNASLILAVKYKSISQSDTE